jgi:putative copper resistance protein D
VSRPTAGSGPADRWAPALWGGIAVGAAAVAAVLAGGLAATTLPVLLGATITRAGMDAVGVACVGVGLVGVLLPLGPGPGARELTRLATTLDRVLVALAGAWLALVLLGIAFRTAAAYGRPVTELGVAELVRFATDLAAGRGLVLAAGCAAVLLVCAVVRLRSPDRLQLRILLVTALLGVLTPTVTGHAGTEPDHEVAVITVALHVGAASLWVGGLGAMLMLIVPRRRALLDVALPRFSRLAGVCIVAVGLTGVLNAVVRLATFGALFTTGYGWLVVAKTVCLVLLGGLGGVARQRLAAGRTPVLRWAGIEVALMAVTLGLAAALTQTGNT